MTEASSTWGAAFAGATLEGMQAYDRFVVPPLFIPFTADLMTRVDPRPGEHALDIATGTGIVARALAERVGTSGAVTACDISPAMLAVAQSKHAPDGAAPITLVETPAAPLDVPSGSFDIATCQQGFQFFPDRPAALAEVRRALREGGRMAVSVWDPIESCPAFEALARAVREVLGDEIGGRYPGPWTCDGEQLADEARDAGFGSVSCEHVQLPCVIESIEALVDTLPAAGIAQAYLDAGPEARTKMIDAVSRTAAELLDGDTIVSHATTSLVIAS